MDGRAGLHRHLADPLQSHGQGFDTLVWQVCGAAAAVNAVKCILLIGYHPHGDNNTPST